MGNGKCVLVYKGKIGFVQLMLVFTCKDDIPCSVAYVHGGEEKNHLKSMQSNQYDTGHTIIKKSVLMKERT